MNKSIKYYCLIIALFVPISGLSAGAFDVFKEYAKVIWINQPTQVGIAYERGKKIFEFPVVTDDDVTTTNPGIYVIKLKDEDYYSRTYDTPMPYSMFFDLKGMKACLLYTSPSP